jgi:DNA-binding GntR family transcriptional regulator
VAEQPSFPRADHVQPRSSGEQAAAYIRRLIFDGDLRQGMRLPQDKVATAMGVSRIPIREAIVALEREGWVTTKLHRGAFVNAFDEEAIRDHYELFGLIYGLAARRAVLRGDSEFVDQLAGIARAIAGTEDPIEMEKLTITFHSIVVDAAKSPRVSVVLRATSALVPGPFFELVPHAMEVEKKGLAAIVRAVRKHDGERAAREYGKMLSQQGELVVALFRQRNLVVRSA